VLESVQVAPIPIDRFASVLDGPAYARFVDAAARSRALFEGRAVWNVNSTARGGGVAEMLVSLLAYVRGIGVDARWKVIRGDPAFFAVTKRIHNHLHGEPGDGGPLGDAERAIYEQTLEPNVRNLLALVRPGDLVVAHDPQTAGLIPALKRSGTQVVWRCHVGMDSPNDLSRAAWRFLIPYVRVADAYVFSRRAFSWEGLEQHRISLIAPSIDAFSPKNQELDAATVTAILHATGLSAAAGKVAPTFTREDGSPGRVDRRAQVLEERPLTPSDRVVLQVSRWDRLKDPIGVIEGFVQHVIPHTDAHLVYAGPAVDAVTDDPEGADVLREARARWHALPAHARERVHLVCLPMVDLAENAAIVNALQRRADVIVQKSTAEGFGLTVAEAMWKGRAVVATRIGGIQDQIEHRTTGLLVDDPHDLAAYGAAVRRLLGAPAYAAEIGRRARERVRREFLGTRSLVQYLELSERVLRGESATARIGLRISPHADQEETLMAAAARARTVEP